MAESEIRDRSGESTMAAKQVLSMLACDRPKKLQPPDNIRRLSSVSIASRGAPMTFILGRSPLQSNRRLFWVGGLLDAPFWCIDAVCEFDGVPVFGNADLPQTVPESSC